MGYAPADATGALLASVALALRLHDQDGFAGRVYAVAPHWSLFARRMLARLGGLPVSLEPVEAPALAEPAPVAPASASRQFHKYSTCRLSSAAFGHSPTLAGAPSGTETAFR